MTNPTDSLIGKLAAIHDKLLTGPSVQNQIMRAWDSARALIQEGDDSDLPRSIFESAIEDIQDDVEECLKMLDELRGEIPVVDRVALKQALDFLDQGFTQWNDEKQLFIDAARAYLRTTEPVSVSLRAGAAAMHNAAYTNDLSERDGFIQEEYLENAKACAEAWGLKYVK